MVSCTSNCFLSVINLANSIIGVSILAMPYCFQKCGILLSMLLILVSGTLVRIACYLLLKCAIMARRRNFEFLAFHALGTTGKLAVEIGIIGFLIGVCIAFFVVIGDLGPPLASQYMMVENTSNLRVQVLVFLGLFVALPLGMLKNVNSLTSLSAFSIAFYGWLVLKIFSEAVAKLALNEWWHQVNWWQMNGLLPCLPIFSMALSCQTQLFEFFDTLVEPSLKRMMSVVNGAVYLCSAVYILVGVFGYIACYDQTITGNVLMNLTPSVVTQCIKLVFVITVVISFPLCLFPCRTSLHSLLFKQGLGHHEIAVNFIPDHRFRVLTISLVIVTISVAIMIPNIEFALGLIGSTIGTMICLILPAVLFIHDTNKNTTEKRLAQVVLFIGIFMLFACTYSTFREGANSKPSTPQTKTADILSQSIHLNLVLTSSEAPIARVKDIEIKDVHLLKDKEESSAVKENVDNQKRQEPPIPREPEVKPIAKIEPKVDLDPQALQKEDKEIQKEILHQNPTPENNVDVSLKEKQEQILRKLEEQQKEQKIILEQQKKVLEELKLHRDIHEEEAKEKKHLEAKDVQAPKSIDINEPGDKSGKQVEQPAEALNKVEEVKLSAERVDKLAINKAATSNLSSMNQSIPKDAIKEPSLEEEQKKVAPEINRNLKPKQLVAPKQKMNETLPRQPKQDISVPDHKPLPLEAGADLIPKDKPEVEFDHKRSIESVKQDTHIDNSMQEEKLVPKLKPDVVSHIGKNQSDIHIQNERSVVADNEKHEM